MPSSFSGTACAAGSQAHGLFGVASGLPGAPAVGGPSGPLGGPAFGGVLGGPVSAVGQGVTSIASTATTSLAFAAIGSSVIGGASFVLHETAHVLSETTTPHLGSTWFSATYWRVAAIAAVLTLPFLFAASVQALMRSDLTMLIRAAVGYLPLAMLAVTIAAPLTMLLLSASDELAAAVSSAAGEPGTNFLDRVIAVLGSLGTFSGSPFLVFLVALLIVGGALVLWIELLMREAAVYVLVLMLPLAFAALVWPARRIWAIRSVELLVALILSKFAIVAVLALGGAALARGTSGGIGGLLAGVVLLGLGAFAPWGLLRLVPLAEVASATAGALRGHSGLTTLALRQAGASASEAHRRSTERPTGTGAAETPPNRPQPRVVEATPPSEDAARAGVGRTAAGPEPAPAAPAAPTPAPGPPASASAGPEPAPAPPATASAAPGPMSSANWTETDWVDDRYYTPPPPRKRGGG